MFTFLCWSFDCFCLDSRENCPEPQGTVVTMCVSATIVSLRDVVEMVVAKPKPNPLERMISVRRLFFSVYTEGTETFTRPEPDTPLLAQVFVALLVYFHATFRLCNPCLPLFSPLFTSHSINKLWPSQSAFFSSTVDACCCGTPSDRCAPPELPQHIN